MVLPAVEWAFGAHPPVEVGDFASTLRQSVGSVVVVVEVNPAVGCPPKKFVLTRRSSYSGQSATEVKKQSEKSSAKKKKKKRRRRKKREEEEQEGDNLQSHQRTTASFEAGATPRRPSSSSSSSTLRRPQPRSTRMMAPPTTVEKQQEEEEEAKYAPVPQSFAPPAPAPSPAAAADDFPRPPPSAAPHRRYREPTGLSAAAMVAASKKQARLAVWENHMRRFTVVEDKQSTQVAEEDDHMPSILGWLLKKGAKKASHSRSASQQLDESVERAARKAKVDLDELRQEAEWTVVSAIHAAAAEDDLLRNNIVKLVPDLEDGLLRRALWNRALEDPLVMRATSLARQAARARMCTAAVKIQSLHRGVRVVLASQRSLSVPLSRREAHVRAQGLRRLARATWGARRALRAWREFFNRVKTARRLYARNLAPAVQKALRAWREYTKENHVRKMRLFQSNNTLLLRTQKASLRGMKTALY